MSRLFHDRGEILSPDKWPTVLLAAKTCANDPLKREVCAGFCTFEGKNPGFEK
jgi:hypothetical protein